MVNTHTHTHKAALSFHCYFKGQVANSKFDKKGTRKILAALAKRMPGAFIDLRGDAEISHYRTKKRKVTQCI